MKNNCLTKKRTLLIGCLFLFVIFTYLNRSYAHIYNTIDGVALQSPLRESVYEFGDRSQKSQVYVALGDSLTAGVGVEKFEQSYAYGVGNLLSKKGDRVDLRTIAVQGARSDTALTFVDDVVKLQPDVITILIGVNDIHGNISKKQFRENYDNIIMRLKDETDAKIYIVNVPYIGAPDLFLVPYGSYFDWQTKRFNETLKELSDTYSTEYVDLYTSTRQDARNAEYYSEDLFHPSSAGYTLWSRIVYDNINP